MKYGELAAALKKFKADLVQHRSLYAQSLNSTMPNFPVKNGKTLPPGGDANRAIVCAGAVP